MERGDDRRELLLSSLPNACAQAREGERERGSEGVRVMRGMQRCLAQWKFFMPIKVV